jgi:type IV pilus assembly protein PilC
MPVFDYSARKPSGEIIQAEVKAANEAAVIKYLQEKGLVVDYIKSQKEPFYLSKYLPGGGVSNKQLLIFTKYFSILVKSGIPVLKALKILEDQTEHPKFRDILSQIYSAVTGGSSLSLAFEGFPDVFPMNYRNLLKIGEESGALHEVLVRLHDNLQKSSKLRGKVIGALIYPLAITLVAAAVVTFLLVVVIPKFVKIFESHGAQLPALTAVVVGASNALVHQWYLVILGIVGGIGGFMSFYRTPFGKHLCHSLILKPPIVGTLMTKYAVASFASNLDMLSRGGASITGAIKLAINSVENVCMREAMSAVVPNVESGMTIAKALEQIDIMPSLVLQMIAVGEETGSLNEMLETICEFYEDEIDASVQTVLALIEPAFIIFLGVVVGTIVIAMYLPIFRMAQAVSSH